MPPFLASLLFSILGKFTGMITGAFGMAFDIFKSGLKNAVYFQKTGIATARQLGMSYEQSIAYTDTLTRRTKDLALAYGITKEQVAELQKTISDSTTRGIMLSDSEADRLAQISKLVGNQTAGVFTDAIINTMGGQLSTMENAVSNAYATAAKSGLNAAKFSSKVAQNLGLANKFAFRDGLNSLTRMTALSEKLGYNLSSIEAAAEKFSNFDTAIETSAHLNMLGGSAGLYGSNPLQMMYESMYDPEKFNKSLTDMLKSYGRYNRKTGMGEVSAINMDMIREISKQLGIGMNEAVSIAKNSSVIREKEAIAGTYLNRIAGDDQMKRDFILNKAQIDTTTNQMYVTGENGQKYSMAELATPGSQGAKWLESTYAYANKSDSEIMAESAQKLTSIDEKLSGMAESIYAKFAEKMMPYFHKLNGYLDEIKPAIKDVVIPAISAIADFIKPGIDFAIAHPIITAVGYGILSVFAGAFRIWIASYSMSWLRAGSAFTKVGSGFSSIGTTIKSIGTNILKSLKWIGDLFKGGWNKLTRLFSPAKNIAKGAVGTVKDIGRYGKYVIDNAKAARSSGNLTKNLLNIFKPAAKIARNGQMYNAALKNANNGFLLGKNLRAAKDVASIARGAKAVGSLGASAGLGIAGMALNTTTDYAAKADLIDKDSFTERNLHRYGTALEGAGIGATVGSIIPGVGTAVGAAVGGIAGYGVEYVQQYMDFHEKTGGNLWDFMKRDVQEFGEEFKKGIHNAARLVNDPSYRAEIGRKIKNMFVNMGRDFSDWIGGITDWVVGAKNKVVAFARNFTDVFEAMARILTGDYVSDRPKKLVKAMLDFWDNPIQTIKNAYNSVTSLVKKVFEGIKNFFGTIWETVKDALSKVGIDIGSIRNEAKNGAEAHANGGIVGGNSYVGDKILTKLNSGELVLNTVQTEKLFTTLKAIDKIASIVDNNTKSGLYLSSFDRRNTYSSINAGVYNTSNIGGNAYNTVSNARNSVSSFTAINRPIGNTINNTRNGGIGGFSTSLLPKSSPEKVTSIVAKPIGEKEYIYKPSKSELAGSGAGNVKVNDINVKISGEIKLSGNGGSVNFNSRDLLNDQSFVRSLKDLIKESISRDMQGGRVMNDVSMMRGMPSNQSVFGKFSR